MIQTKIVSVNKNEEKREKVNRKNKKERMERKRTIIENKNDRRDYRINYTITFRMIEFRTSFG